MKKKPAKAKKRAPVVNPKPAAPANAPRPRPPRNPPTRSIDKRQVFLRAYGVSASIGAAAAIAKIDRQQHYKWLKTDPEYALRFQQTKMEAAQSVEDEIAERAMRGVYEPNIFQGRFIYPQEEILIPAVVGPRGGIIEPERREWRDAPGAKPLGIWRKSDTLLIHLSRGLMPEKYSMRGQFELSGPHGGPMEIVERLNAARARMAAKRDKTE